MVEVVVVQTTCTTCPGLDLIQEESGTSSLYYNYFYRCCNSLYGLDLVGGDVVEVVCSTDYFYHVSWIRSSRRRRGRSSL